jgi:hypothetical protein
MTMRSPTVADFFKNVSPELEARYTAGMSRKLEDEDHYDTKEEASAAALAYYEDPERWTEKGWPRPRSPFYGGLPVPWVSPIDELKRTHPGRMAEVVENALCQICGLPHEPDATVYLLVNEANVPDDLETKWLQAMDNAVMHEQCFKLAYGRCPALRELRMEYRLQVFTAPRSSVMIHNIPVGTEFDDQYEERVLGVDGANVTLVATLSRPEPG